MKWRKVGRGSGLAVLLVVAVATGLGAGCGKAGADKASADKAGSTKPGGSGAGSGAGAGGRGPAAAPVVTGQVKAQPVALLVAAVGTVEPIESVAVRPQVGGVVTDVSFTEGQDVRAGQVLFRIDARPLQAALDAAEAQLARNRAQAANSAAQAERYDRLVEKDYVTREQADAARTQADVFAASVQADEAAVRQAKLNLAYATVSSPVAGRAGAALVKLGNVVAVGGPPLVVVNQLDPIRVTFALPGSRLPEVRRHQAGGALVVRAMPAGATEAEAVSGRLVFVDNAVAPNTGTVAMKAEFANTDQALWPGQFVDVEVELAIEQEALTVPAAAVVTGQAGLFVYVVDADSKAQRVPVTLLRTVGGLSVVAGELSDGQAVVVDGQIRVVPGGAVQVKDKPTEVKDKPAAAPPAQGSGQ